MPARTGTPFVHSFRSAGRLEAGHAGTAGPPNSFKALPDLRDTAASFAQDLTATLLGQPAAGMPRMRSASRPLLRRFFGNHLEAMAPPEPTEAPVTDMPARPTLSEWEVIALIAYLSEIPSASEASVLTKAVEGILARFALAESEATPKDAQHRHIQLIPRTDYSSAKLCLTGIRFETKAHMGGSETTDHDLYLAISAPWLSLEFMDCELDALYLAKGHLLSLTLQNCKSVYQPGVILWAPDLRLEHDLILTGQAKNQSIFALAYLWGLRANDVLLSGPFVGGHYVEWRQKQKDLDTPQGIVQLYSNVITLDECSVHSLHLMTLMSYGCCSLRHGRVQNLTKISDCEFADYPRRNAEVFALDFRAAHLGEEFQFLGLKAWTPTHSGVRGFINLSLARTRILSISARSEASAKSPLASAGIRNPSIAEKPEEKAIGQAPASVTFRIGLDGFRFEQFGEMRARIDIADTRDAQYIGNARDRAHGKIGLRADVVSSADEAEEPHWTTDPKLTIALLKLQPNQDLDGHFKAQPWTQFASVLRAQGTYWAANEVLYERERLANRANRLNGRWAAWAAWTGLAALPGYGYRQWRTFVACIVIVLAFAPLYAAAFQAGYFIKDPDASVVAVTPRVGEDTGKGSVQAPSVTGDDYPDFNALAYSLDVFIPVIDFAQGTYWIPGDAGSSAPAAPQAASAARKTHVTWLWLAYWFQIAAGWYLTTVIIAGMTGLIERKE
ncbi:MAG TPA: hypothetical protein DCL48_07980 [Alphaproteobacteria bacterium]|nr:hypothetical protein [Alphaproteobacteria bacterium]